VCDGQGHCTTGNVLWAQRFGSIDSDRFYEAAFDTDGNVVLAGHFSGTVTFGGQALESAGGHDVVVVKLDPAGNHVWSKRFGGIWRDQPRGLAIRPNGNVLVVGYVASEVDFGGGPEAHFDATDAFLLELDPSGNHVASRVYGGTGDDVALSVAAVDDTAVVITGFADDTISFGGVSVLTVNPPVNSHQYFVARVVRQGSKTFEQVWAKLVEGSMPEPFVDPVPELGVAVDGAGNAIVAGNFLGLAGFSDGAELNATGGADDIDGFVGKLSPSGDHSWSRRFGSVGQDRTDRVLVDGPDRIFLAGYAQGDVSSTSAPSIESHGGADALVLQLDGAGNLEWGTQIGGPYSESALGLGLDEAGNLLLAGQYWSGPTELGGPPLPHVDHNEVFAVKLARGTNELVHLWSHGFTGPGGDVAGGAMRADGLVAIAGQFGGSLDVAGIELNAASTDDKDAFVALLEP
jgi:hypothetical protein